MDNDAVADRGDHIFNIAWLWSRIRFGQVECQTIWEDPSSVEQRQRTVLQSVNVEVECDNTVGCKAEGICGEVNRIFKIPVLYLTLVRTKVHALGPYYFAKLLHVRNTT